MNRLIEILNNPSITNNRIGKIPIKTTPPPPPVAEHLDRIQADLKEVKLKLEKLKNIYKD